MFETPVDAVYVWVGLGLASVAALGVAVELPTESPPDADGAATTVDGVATSEYEATAHYRSGADRVRVGPRRVWLRNDGGRATAAFVTRVVPARSDRLERVLHGAAPERVFDSPAAFTDAVEEAREGTPRWRPTDGRIVVRHVTWGEEDVTLVGD